MIFVVNSTKYFVTWEYKHSIDPNSPFRVRTWCRIFTEESNQVCEAHADCSWEDQFVRRIGRKLAFKRAINTIFKCDKTYRSIAWAEYHNMTNRVNTIRQATGLKSI